MKNLIFTLIIPFLSPLASLADDAVVAQTLVESIKDVNSIQVEVNKVGSVERPCPSCDGDSFSNIKMKMEKEMDLGRKIFFTKNEKPINVILERDENSPSKMTITFENPYRVCAKHYVGPSMLPGSGTIMIDCLMYVSEFEKEKIDIDLSKLPKPEAGKTQSVVISIKKYDITRTKYVVDAYYSGEGKAAVEVSNKFWGSGRNVVLRKPASEE